MYDVISGNLHFPLDLFEC